MVVPRGLKKFMVDSAPTKLGKTGCFKAFKSKETGRVFSGITKKLNESLFSSGYIDYHCGASERQTKPGWKGSSFKRGKAVDSQVSRLASASKARQKKATLIYSRHCFSALEKAGLEAICGQRGVCDETLGLATAIDVVCWREKDKQLVCVELKTGFHADRCLPARHNGKPCYMSKPCEKAMDSTLNRHLAQLAATRSLFNSEPGLLKALAKFGVEGIDGVLLYVDDSATEVHDLPAYWVRRAKAILRILR